MLKKLFKPKIIKNYKSSAASSTQATQTANNRRKQAKSVNTYNYFSRNDGDSMQQTHSLNQGADLLSVNFN